MNDEELTTKQELTYVGIGVLIAITYTVLFIVVTDDYKGWLGIFIIPEAHAQILPFEQQLEQIRDPKECTRKVVQGSSAELPFTLKVVYDTSRDIKLEFKQQGTSFPVVQRTNQVMTFYTDGVADQYEIYVEVNYDEAKSRQMYIEYLSMGQITQSEQEKFETKKFCMTVFVNTIIPTPVPTKEEIFGESLDYISQIPAMVTAFNANSQTSATSIAFIWLLLLATVILSGMIYINTLIGKRGFDSKMRDFDDSIKEVNKMTQTMDDLERSVKDPLNEIKEDLKEILGKPQIRERLKKKESKLDKIKKIIPSIKKKEDEVDNFHVEIPTKDESEEILKELQPTPKEIEEEREILQSEPTGGYVIGESEEDLEPEIEDERILKKAKKESPMGLQPSIFKQIITEIDFEKKELKKDAIEKFTYEELNESYAWIAKYKKWAEDEHIEIPSDALIKQEISEGVIYDAVMAKINARRKI